MSTEPDARLAHLQRVAWWLDSGIGIPGTRFRIGADAIIGLVPVLGDAAGAVLAATFLAEGVRRGVSRATLVRIAFNIAVDALLGVVPLLGDFSDAVWKANVRNVALLERHWTDPGRARRSDRLFIAALVGTLALTCAALIVGSALLTVWLFRVATGG